MASIRWFKPVAWAGDGVTLSAMVAGRCERASSTAIETEWSEPREEGVLNSRRLPGAWNYL
jgi:hypothetical protein